MALYNPYSSLFRERIMVFGSAGMGKSYNFYTIARLAKNTGSDARFFIVDLDESVGRMLVDPGFRDVLMTPDLQAVNIIFETAEDWVSLNGVVEKFQKMMRPQDWLMIDMLSPTWTMVSDFYTNEIFHKSLDAYMLEKRKELQKAGGKDSGTFDGWKDWDKINALYDAFALKLLRCPGNLYVTSEQKSYASQNATKDDKNTFGPWGVMPVGKKSMPHKFSTILWEKQDRPGEYTLTTCKDRSRTDLAGAKVNDFSVDYLVNTAGWRLTDPVAVAA